MKNLLGFILVFVTCWYNLDAQKVYEFDKLLEYRLFRRDSGIIETSRIWFLTNSKVSNYYCEITEKKTQDSVLNFNFFDMKGDSDYRGYHSKFIVDKNAWFETEDIAVSCENYTPFRNAHRFKSRDSELIRLRDTLIKGVNHKRILYRSTRKKLVKRKKLGTLTLTVEPNTENFRGIIRHGTFYENGLKWGVGYLKVCLSF